MTADRTRLPGCWYRLALTLPRDLEDDVVGALASFDCEGTATRPAGPRRIALDAWFTDEAAASAALDLVRGLPGVTGPGAPEPVEDPGWLEASLVVRGPLEAGRFVVLDRAEDRELVPAGRIAILLPPGRAFGTGEHATTRMCLEWLDRLLVPGTPVLDLGTGSAILAIAARKAGGGPVLALDNDPNVIDVAAENLELNGLAAAAPGADPVPDGAVELGAGSWGQVPRGRFFGLILANIHRTALVRGAHALAGHLLPGGRAVLSGFHTGSDAALVRDAWSALGLVAEGELQHGEWAALAMRRPESPDPVA